MTDATAQHKQMPDCVGVFYFFHCVEYGAKGIKQSAANQPVKYFHRTGSLQHMDKRFEGKEPKFKSEICGGDIASSDYAGNAIERYAGSSLRILGVKITFWVDKEWIICTKCGDKIHARLQAGED